MDAVRHETAEDGSAERLATLRMNHEAVLGQIKKVEQIIKKLSGRIDGIEVSQYQFEMRRAGMRDSRMLGAPTMLSKDLTHSGRRFFACYILVMSVAVASAMIIASLLTPNCDLNRYIYGNGGRQTHCESAIPKDEKAWGSKRFFSAGGSRRFPSTATPEELAAILSNSKTIYAEAADLGLIRTNAVRCSILVLVAFCCVVLAAVVPTALVTFRPEFVHQEFQHLGTLSNLGHDITLPRGRVFTTMLFAGSLLSLLSGYPHFLYESWFRSSPRKVDVLFSNYQRRREKIARSAWVVIPNVGLMLTAALPSLKDNSGTNLILTLLHNLAAPFSLFYVAVMEAVQLGYGENAFNYFFCSDEDSSWFGALGWLQRVRVVILGYLWIAGAIFISMQIYFGSAFFCGVKIKTSYTLALFSLYAEISALILAYCLPVIQAVNALQAYITAPSVFERAASLQAIAPPGSSTPAVGDASSMLQSNLSHHLFHLAQRTNFAKHLRAGADGQPLF